MKIEISAGGVVYKIIGKKPMILLLKDKNDNWTFPKGLIEDKEDKIETAKREIGEEVGLKKIKFIRELQAINYWYRWQKDLIKKTVYYFLFRAFGNEELEPQEEEGMKEARWVDLGKAIEVIGYRKTNELVLKEAIETIKDEK